MFLSKTAPLFSLHYQKWKLFNLKPFGDENRKNTQVFVSYVVKK